MYVKWDNFKNRNSRYVYYWLKKKSVIEIALYGNNSDNIFGIIEMLCESV